MNFLEKSRNKLVHFLFPFIGRVYQFLSLGLLVAAVFIPNREIGIIFWWLWFVIIEINSAGVMERDYLPIQPGSSPFYHVYRFIDQAFCLFLLIWPVILLIPVPGQIKYAFLGVFIIVTILRAIGDKKYRPKKPEE